jgi:hypothetical protein
MSVCGVFRNDGLGSALLESTVAQQPDPTVSIVQQSPGITLVKEWPKAQQRHSITLAQQRPKWCGVNTFGTSVYFKEYTFPIFLNYTAGKTTSNPYVQRDIKGFL